MKTQDKESYENQWQEAFAGAELEVPVAVWDKVALGVANADNGKYKKRLLVLQLMAAASVAFALSIGGIAFYNNYDTLEESAVVALDNTPTEKKGLEVTTFSKEKETVTSTDIHKEAQPVLKEGESKTEKKILPSWSKKDRTDGMSSAIADNRKEKSLSPQQMAAPEHLESQKSHQEPLQLGEIELNMVPRLEYAYIKRHKQTRDAWIGVGMLAGTFDPNVASSGGNNTLTGARTSALSTGMPEPAATEAKSGSVMNMGLNVGKQLSRKWLVQGGLSYMVQRSAGSGNLIVENNFESATNSFTQESDLKAFDNIVSTDEYDISNTYELLSVPLQVGYILVDSKINVILLGGIASDVMLSNTIENSADLPETSGNDHRKYAMSGLLSSEISYQLGENYSISLTPQIRQYLNSVTKSSLDYDSKPVVMEIGFRFKYLLK